MFLQLGILVWMLGAIVVLDSQSGILDPFYSTLLTRISAVFSMCWLFIFAAGAYLVYKKRSSKIYLLLVLYFFAGSMLVNAWFSGIFSFTAGVVTVAASIVVLLFFDSRSTFQVPVVALFAFTVIALLTLFRQIPYAPIFDRPLVRGTDLWALDQSVHFAFSMGFFIYVFYVMNFFVKQWRHREDLIHHLSTTDELTGINNRRGVMRVLEHEIKRFQRHQKPLTLAIFDLDHFKKINDNHGHDVGDKALVATAEAIGNHLRDVDTIGRYGGEEFVLILPDTQPSAAMEVIERCRFLISQIKVETPLGEVTQFTASFGVYTFEKDSFETSVSKALTCADQALYRAKDSGRNKVVKWTP